MTAWLKQIHLRRTMRFSTSYAILALVTCLIALPAVWLVITSFKKEIEYLAYPIKILPAEPQWVNYNKALTLIPFHRYAWNSFFLAMSFTILTIVTSAMGGFAFSRFQVPGRNALFMIVIALLIVPGIVTVIPQFIVFSRLRLTNTYWPWILWGLSASPFHIFLFRQFFATIPRELEDAAEVDGCGPFRIFWQIFLPNSKPALATSFIFNFSWVWGDWFTPLIYLSDANTTLAVKLGTAYLDPQGHSLITITLAACVIYTLPLIILFFLGQQYIIKGVVTTGLKG
jgi:ABC-type glycerol-3-phosphate transport system permease component